ncbi:hypothetical protein OIU79_012044, partial [Salix purpurea]
MESILSLKRVELQMLAEGRRLCRKETAMEDLVRSRIRLSCLGKERERVPLSKDFAAL